MKRKLEVKNLNQPLYRKEGRRHLTGDVTMKTQKLEISGIPALLYGKESRKVYLYVHGKMGCKEEALPFAELACPAGYQVLAVDLPEHGERKGSSEKLLPWVAVSRVGSGLFLCCRALEECFAAGYKYWSLVFHVGLTGKAFTEYSFALTSGRYGRSYHQYDAVGKCE